MRQRGEDAVTVQAQQGKGGAYATEQHRGQQEDKDGEQSERARHRQHRVIGHPTETTVAVARTMRSPGFGTHPGRSIEHARRGILHTRGGAFGGGVRGLTMLRVEPAREGMHGHQTNDHKEGGQKGQQQPVQTGESAYRNSDVLHRRPPSRVHGTAWTGVTTGARYSCVGRPTRLRPDRA